LIDSATNATNAGNATNATNASKLGGVLASSYLTNGGTIFVATGTFNWHSLVVTSATSTAASAAKSDRGGSS
jgi:hypothetical protein